MNKIEKMVKELCPDGIEWKKLGEVSEIGTGVGNKIDAVENGLYPFYVRSKQILRSNNYLFDETAIIVPGEGGIGDIFHYIDGKYNLHQRAYRIHIIDSNINTKFIYYYMHAFFKNYISSYAVKSTVFSIRLPMLINFLIPIPPLEVQAEIVKILDNFTELQAELQARKKQYEYYRDKLLSFDNILKRGGDS